MPKISYLALSAEVTHSSTIQFKAENGFDVWVIQILI